MKGLCERYFCFIKQLFAISIRVRARHLKVSESYMRRSMNLTAKMLMRVYVLKIKPCVCWSNFTVLGLQGSLEAVCL